MSTEPVQPLHPEPEHFPEVQQDFDEPQTATAIAPIDQTGPMTPPPMPHVEHTYQRASFVCVRCGSTNIAHGYVVDYGDKFEQIRFAPKRITLGWLNSIRALRPWKSLVKLNAEACRDCGAVLIVIDPDELRRAERVRD